MCIQHVRINTALRILIFYLIAWQQFQQVIDHLKCMIPIQQTCPKINFPTHRPARCFVTSLNQRILSRLKQKRMGIRRNLITGIKAIHMRNMPMLIFGIVGIFQPFLQLIVSSDLHRRQLFQHSLQWVLISNRFSQYFRCFFRLIQYIKDDLIIHGTSGCNGWCLVDIFSARTMFGRHGRSTDHPAILRVFYQEGQEEIGGTF